MYIRDQVIQILNLAHAEMRQALEQFNPDTQIFPTWQTREMLAHIAGWDQLLIDCIQAHAKGETYAPAGFPDTDEFNQQSLQARAELTPEQVTADWRAQRLALVAALQTMPEERFQQPLMFPWGQVGTVEDILRGFAAHERRHAAEMAALLG